MLSTRYDISLLLSLLANADHRHFRYSREAGCFTQGLSMSEAECTYELMFLMVRKLKVVFTLFSGR